MESSPGGLKIGNQFITLKRMTLGPSKNTKTVPLTFQVGLPMPSALTDWVSASATRYPSIRSGEIHVIVQLKPSIAFSFSSASISDVEFPELDARNMGLGLVTIVIDIPVASMIKIEAAEKLPPRVPTYWRPKDYRITHKIQGFPEGLQTNKVSSITWEKGKASPVTFTMQGNKDEVKAAFDAFQKASMNNGALNQGSTTIHCVDPKNLSKSIAILALDNLRLLSYQPIASATQSQTLSFTMKVSAGTLTIE
jgi:hypothetical protein